MDEFLVTQFWCACSSFNGGEFAVGSHADEQRGNWGLFNNSCRLIRVFLSWEEPYLYQVSDRLCNYR